MQGLQEGHERGGFGRSQVLAVGRHVAATLNHLTNQLVLRQAHGDAVERRTSLAATLIERMTIAALLRLKHERALSLECGRPVEECCGHRLTAPRAHLGTPWSVLGETRKRTENEGDQQDGQDRDRSSAPALLSFAGQEWQEHENGNGDRWTNQQRRRLERRWQEREQRIEPQEEVVGLRHRLDDRWIRLPGWSERTEDHCAGTDS